MLTWAVTQFFQGPSGQVTMWRGCHLVAKASTRKVPLAHAVSQFRDTTRPNWVSAETRLSFGRGGLRDYGSSEGRCSPHHASETRPEEFRLAGGEVRGGWGAGAVGNRRTCGVGGRVLLPVPQDFCGHEEEALLAGGTVVQLVQCGGGGLTCRNTFRKVWGRGKQD